MPNIPDKLDNAGQFLFAQTEWNAFKNSLQNTIVDAGGALIGNDEIQFRQALNSYASIASFYIDTGTATEYVLNPQGAFKAPVDAPTTWDGMLVRFRPTNNNTGIATLRLAGLSGGLPFNISREDATPIQAGDFSTARDAILRYSQSLGAFILLNSNLYAQVNSNIQAQQRIIFSYNSPTVLNYSAGGFIFDDYTGSATVTAGTINLATNGLNGLDVGTVSANGWLYTYAVQNPTTGASGLVASANSTTPTLTHPSLAGFTKKRRIRNGYIKIEASAIRLFTHTENGWIPTNIMTVVSQINVVNYTNLFCPVGLIEVDVIAYFSLTQTGQSTMAVWGNVRPFVGATPDAVFLAQNNGASNSNNGSIQMNDGTIRATHPVTAGGVGNAYIGVLKINELN